MQVAAANQQIAQNINKLNQMMLKTSDQVLKFNDKVLDTAITDTVETQALIAKASQINTLA